MKKSDPMEGRDPMEDTRLVRQCKATSRSHARCRKPAIQGGTVCRLHGGAAPQVIQAARERLAALVDPSITRLSRLIQDKAGAVALGAVKDVLDRNGLKMPAAIQILSMTPEDLAKMPTEELVENMLAMVAQLRGEARRLPPGVVE